MRDTFYTAVDIGTSKVTALLSRVGTEGDLKIFGLGIVPSEGIQRGRVENIEEVKASVNAALAEAQRYVGGESVSSGAYVSVSGSHISSINRSEILDNQENPDDISARMIDGLLQGSFPSIAHGQQVLHVIPMGYTVDGLSGVRNPMGLAGKLVEVDAHVVVGDAVVLQNTINSVTSKDTTVRSLVLQGLASAESTLTGDEREMGVVLMDIGAGTTDIVVYRQGTPWFSTVLPLGSNALTRDLAAALRAPLYIAEEVKTKYGSVNPESVPASAEVELPNLNGQRRHSIPIRALAEPLHDRMAEIMKMAIAEVRQTGLRDWPIGGLVLTGGGAEMTGLPELAARLVGEPVRVGYPYGIYGLPDQLRKPKFSASVGLLLWGIKHQDSSQMLSGESKKESKTRRWRPRFRPIGRKKNKVETG
jgi:cell division protein FtsA